MSSTPQFNGEQLAAARTERWHQGGDALLTLEAVKEWINELGLVLFAPRAHQLPTSAPTLVEATLGRAVSAPTALETDTARVLLARMTTDGTAMPLNLLGGPGDVPDFVVSAQVFSYLFTLRGDKNWKQPPSTSGTVKVAPLSLKVYELLAKGTAMTAGELVSELGREVTENAISRALVELWTQLRVIPLLQQDGAATMWELTSRRFTKQIKAGANAGQPTALSALISMYLAQALVATEEEVETFLSPVAARSRVRDVLHGLTAARQLENVVLEGKTLLYIPGALPEFPEIAVEPVAEGEGEAATVAAAAETAGGERIRRFDRPRAPREERGERRPYRREGESGGEKRPYRREGAEGGERRPYRREGAAGGERRPYRREGAAGGERRPYRREGESGGEKRPYRREGAAGGERRPYRSEGESSGERRPYRREGEGGGERRPYRREGAAGGERRPYRREGAGGGERRPYRREGGDRPRPSKPFGERKREGGGEPRPYSREGGERPRPSKPFGERERRPFNRDRAEGGAERKSFARPWDEDRKPRPRREEGERREGGRPFRKEGGREGGGFRKTSEFGGKSGFSKGPKRDFGSAPRRSDSERGERPYRPRPDGEQREGRESKPFRRSEGTREGGAKRPYRSAEGGERPRYGGKPGGRPGGKPGGRPGGKPGFGGKGKFAGKRGPGGPSRGGDKPKFDAKPKSDSRGRDIRAKDMRSGSKREKPGGSERKPRPEAEE